MSRALILGTALALLTTTEAVWAQAASSEPKVAGRDVPAPARRKYVAPTYPPEAALAGTRGIVIVELLISETGSVESARVTRSIAGLDEAALAAVKGWEFEPTRVDGKAVKVSLSQSITFTMPLPSLTRGAGVPELKSGASPLVPRSGTPPGEAEVEITLGSGGEVAEAQIASGTPPWSEALLRSVRYWKFDTAGSLTKFRVRATFAPGNPITVALSATGVPSAGTEKAPEPPPSPGASSPAPLAAPPAASPSATPDAPTEVLPGRPSGQVEESGTSSVTDVALGDKLPDLVRGRRPTLSPLARLGNAAGEVVVRFSVDVAGRTNVQSVEGPDLLKPAAEGAVQTWVFRRSSVERLALVATFTFAADRASARVERQGAQ